MTLKTIVGYLIGNRRSIVEIAHQPQAIWVALLFVLSAGFAREYDGEDLLAEPWHLLLPLAASLVTATVLFGLLWPLRIGDRVQYPSYRAFLTLYWMTAPLAWLYAIPVERFLSAPGSVRANLWLLAIVSLWRVVLMSRVVSVLYYVRYWQALVIVMLFGDTIALIVLYFTPLPIFNIMGGIRLTESEQIIQGTAFFVGFWGMLTWPVWLIASLVAIHRARNEAISEQATPPISEMGSISLAVWALAIASIAIWALVLPKTQPEQQRRRYAERLLLANNLDEAIVFLSQFEQSQFPPHWDPPPHVGYGEEVPDPLDALEAMPDKVPDWLRNAYRDKLPAHEEFYFSRHPWDRLDNHLFDYLLRQLEQLKHDASLLEVQRPALEIELEKDEREPFHNRIRKLLDLPQDATSSRE